MTTITNLVSNPWVIGIGSTVIAGAIIYILGFEKNEDKTTVTKQLNRQVQNVVVNNHIGKGYPDISGSKYQGAVPSQINAAKEDTRILFIDDLDLKKKIKNLKDAGWCRVSQIKDAPNIDIQEIREADIIFVDYKGIGEFDSEEQGLSVLKALKQRYRDSKYLILYSAHKVPVDAFNRGADNYLQKNSSIYELEQKILEGIAKIGK